MKTSLLDLIYLKRLRRSLQSLLKLFVKPRGKPLTKPQKKAILRFKVKPEKGLAEFVQRVCNQATIIPGLCTSDPESVKYFLEMLLSLARLQYDTIYHVDMKKLKAVQKELNNNGFYLSMKRNNFVSRKETQFEAMISDFLKTDFERDNRYEQIADLAQKYLVMLEYYWKHKKEIEQTKLWYDFLAISAFMLYGTKLEVQILKNIRKR